MYKSGVQYNTLTTVNNVNQNHGRRCTFLKSIGSYHAIPACSGICENCSRKPDKRPVIVPETSDHNAPWSVSAESYGTFV